MESEISIAKKKIEELGVNFRSKNGDALIHLCADANAPMVHACANMGQNINLQNFDGNTALHLAVRKGNAEVVNSLLMCGADPNVRNKLGQTTYDIVQCESILSLLKIYKPGLLQAVTKGDFPHLLKLVNRLCVNLTSIIKDDKTALMIAEENAMKNSNHTRCFSMLQEQKHTNKLFHAVLEDDIQVVQEMVNNNHKYNINKRCKDKHGWTPVTYATAWRCYDIIEALINTGKCNINIRVATEPLATTTEPLYFKSLNGNCPVDIWRLVRDNMDRGQDSERDETGNTGIFRALQCGKSAEFIEELIKWKNGGCITERNSSGQTPREVAANTDRGDVTQIIDDYICDNLHGEFLVQLPISFYEKEYLNIKNKDGVHLQTLVKENGTQNDIQAFLNYDAIQSYGIALFKAVEEGDLKGVARYNKSHYTDRNGFTALTKAIAFQQIRAAEILMIERPELKVIPDNHNRYPLHYAYSLPSGVSEEFVSLILSRDAVDLEHRVDKDGRLPVDYRDLRDTDEINQLLNDVKALDVFGKRISESSQGEVIEDIQEEDKTQIDHCNCLEISQNEETGETETKSSCEMDKNDQMDKNAQVAC